MRWSPNHNGAAFCLTLAADSVRASSLNVCGLFEPAWCNTRLRSEAPGRSSPQAMDAKSAIVLPRSEDPCRARRARSEPSPVGSGRLHTPSLLVQCQLSCKMPKWDAGGDFKPALPLCRVVPAERVPWRARVRPHTHVNDGAGWPIASTRWAGASLLPRSRWSTFRCGKPGSIVPLLPGFFLSGSCKAFKARLPLRRAWGSFPSQVTSFRADGPRPCCNARGCDRRPGPIKTRADALLPTRRLSLRIRGTHVRRPPDDVELRAHFEASPNCATPRPVIRSVQ